MDPNKRHVLISKSLSKLLRHQAVKENLDIDEQGFVPLDQLLNHRYLKSLNASPQDIFWVVNNNEKKRFRIAFKSDDQFSDSQTYDPLKEYFVCALQGHSLSMVNDSYNMVKLTSGSLPETIVHGTYLKNLEAIRTSGGLSKMKRNHIHFAKGLPAWLNDASAEPIISGMRKSCNLLIFLDVEKLRKSPLVFYESGNGVILTPGDENGIVSTHFFLKVTDTKGNPIAF
ncbi:hypothetical protein OGAPHI_003511 [Ogataea philodendri]|uniref:2'-phosphotransferase n=1 Tax=Ogataea philodendri TaxID=1378263 RepID=A0A9P8T5X4_9ASCO|nr:uncharacterized protein OGAPHI_003511 [Ogataea philodendri]KAH3666515.1 hypothetical protein OGAPHI_003511 [Ogataea philodendri]